MRNRAKIKTENIPEDSAYSRDIQAMHLLNSKHGKLRKTFTNKYKNIILKCFMFGVFVVMVYIIFHFIEV
jgi:hypothetical protein